MSLCFLAVYVKEAGDDNSPERAPCVNVAQLVQSFRRNMLWLLWRPEFWRRNISNGLGPLSRPLVRMKAFRWECKEAANPKLVGHSDAFVSVDLGTSIWVWFFLFFMPISCYDQVANCEDKHLWAASSCLILATRRCKAQSRKPSSTRDRQFFMRCRYLFAVTGCSFPSGKRNLPTPLSEAAWVEERALLHFPIRPQIKRRHCVG